MSNIIPFNFDGAAVRAVQIAGEPWFVAADVCAVLEISDVRQAVERLDEDERGGFNVPTPGGTQEVRCINESGLYSLILTSRKPEARRFKKWVTSEVLPSIRKTGSYVAPAAAGLKAVPAAKEFRAVFGVLRLIGCDKQAAAIGANQAAAKLTGTNLLELSGSTHIEAANQEDLYFTPTELGKRAGTSARGMNLLLAEAGLQMKRGDVWEVTDAGKDFARIYDTGKKHGSGVPVQQIKWAASVLGVLGEGKEAA